MLVRVLVRDAPNEMTIPTDMELTRNRLAAFDVNMGPFVSRRLRTILITATAMALIVACGSEATSGFGSGAPDGEDAGPPAIAFAPPIENVDGGTLVRNSCVPRTCAEQGIECGPAGDGCGGIIADCGTCGDGKRCGGPNVLSKCVETNIASGCTPKSCTDLEVECGQAGDGCGGILPCGVCPAGKQCGGPGAPSKCVTTTATGPDGGACVPLVAADYYAQAKNCGTQSNGCGGTIVLPVCPPGETCGGGGPSKCGVPGVGGACSKKTCNDYPGTCGPQPDGCNGVTPDCGPCTLPQICGGGGVPGKCGGGGVTGPGGGICTPLTVANCGPSQCGVIPDGCGGTVDCGTSKCTAGQVCGGAGQANLCAAPPCTPLTACPAGLNCGSIANGCGGLVECGGPNACQNGQICGGGGVGNVCGGGSVVQDGGTSCTPITACLPNQCGPIANGCGGIVQCADCTGGAVCGGGGTPSVCAGGTCKKRTFADCATLGVNCGYIADGCGGTPISCWPGGAATGTCANNGICGLNQPNVCSDSPVTCTGFCQNQATSCGTNPAQQTRITGKIYAPNGSLPIPDALVYVPNGATTPPYGVQPITSGVASGGCDSCNSQASGSPLVSTTTKADGSFTLSNVPAGVSFPIVIQLGKWRRMVQIPATTACQSRTLTTEQSRLPKFQDEGAGNGIPNGINNIPLVAISTGSVDGLECVFHKLGINTNQFARGNQNSGRIRLYRNVSGGDRGASMPTGTTPDANTLWDTQAHLDAYDAVIFSCGGSPNVSIGNGNNAPFGTTATGQGAQARIRAYADKGGRMFATHFQYVWLNNNDEGAAPHWQDTVNWDVGNARNTNPIWGGTWDAVLTAPPVGTPANDPKWAKRRTFAEWVKAPGVTADLRNGQNQSYNPPRIRITEARNNADRNVSAASEEWLTRHNDPDDDDGRRAVLHYTFNTPIGAAQQCGRVLFSDFHVSIGNTENDEFPDHCDSNNGNLTNQEKILAFFLFDLTSCIQQPQPPTCPERTCASYPAGTCGQQSNGCGGLTPNCLTCPNGQTCGGAGVPNQCGTPTTCQAKTCAQLGAQCGQVPDGCGNLLTCNNCPNGQTCGGGGVANQCGAPSCTAKACPANYPAGTCGQQSNGCGGMTNCPACPSTQTCGGGGIPNQCGAPSCTPLTQCPPGKNCGTMPNGCGGVLNCGMCPNGQSCGGGGSANVCGAASCSPKSCEMQGAQCGIVSNGCGGVDTCDDCTNNAFCNAQNICVPPTCAPTTCEANNVECGPLANGCGGLLQCGTCPVGTVCGGGGVPGRCGANPCTPATCADLEADCGQLANGCGGLTPDCGTCSGSLSCKNGVCIQACTPRTCTEAGANCGFIADGCGSTVDCGTCADGLECGFQGRANVCGSSGPK